MIIENIRNDEVNNPDTQLPHVWQRITLTLSRAEGEYVKSLCDSYDIGPTRVFRTLLGLDCRSGHIRKEVAACLKNATALCRVTPKLTAPPVNVAEK
ncbi:MAG: hypothetical protein WCQ21_33130 [Verrucomicrobiota bacterium]|jgi:hypothetical protein